MLFNSLKGTFFSMALLSKVVAFHHCLGSCINYTENNKKYEKNKKTLQHLSSLEFVYSCKEVNDDT
jgi:hypothetical protein